MRPIWTGALTFGLVNIPVRLMSAVRGGERLSFRQLHADDLSPIKYQRVCQRDGEEVPWGDIVKGFEFEKGKFVVLTDEDFKAAALESSKALDILDFVRDSEIDPRYFETPYYLVPGKGGEKAYGLLREAIRRRGMVGLGKLSMRANSHHLVAVKAVGNALVLEVMRFADELVDPADFSLPSADDVRPQELEMAEQLVANLAEPFDPAKYKDDYKENLERIIRAKLKGKKVKFEEPEAREATEVLDLMARLQESLAQGKRKNATKRVVGRSRGRAAKAADPATPNEDTSGETGGKRPARGRQRRSA